MPTKPRLVLDEEGLTQQEAAFVDEYILDLSPKHAAIRAGISPLGVTASAWATQHGRKPEVKAAIELRIAKKRAKLQRLRDRLVNEMTALSTSRAKDYRIDPVTGEVTLDGVSLENEDSAHAAVKSIKHEVRYERDPDSDDPRALRAVHETKIELWDKNSAIRNLGQHLGMFIDRTAVATDPEHPDGELTVWDFGGKKIKF